MNRLIHGAEPIAPRRSVRGVARHGAIAVLLLAACATTPSGTPVKMTELGAPPPSGAPFEPIGELLFTGGRSAAYSLHRVVGPTVNLTYTADGKWAGNLDGRDVRLTAAPGKLTGAGVDLNIISEGDQVTIRGLWFQRKVWLDISPKKLTGRAGGPSYDFTRTAKNLWSGRTAAGLSGLEARGNAQKFPDVPMPQFALALLAALP
ncbi:hypothetical protein [Anaeromyxobacter oryzae]|uniref:Lipoprotein n=1 Tax=Anaeromyxobacter oryzae TaxID=2918170 RepID=A0ABN6N108_9BACT|nr:hypothetical protein [Anaeromyxobacter oryzae]BDG05625.1 hypothetical protein AMOR_46210 [Anaeromyxobacter oryzae]